MMDRTTKTQGTQRETDPATRVKRVLTAPTTLLPLLPLCSLCLCGSTLPGRAADDPAATAREILAQVARAEAEAGTGRLTLTTADRRGAFKATELLSETKRRIGGEAPMKAEGTMLHSRDGWLKELTVSVPGSDKPMVRTRTAESGGVLRNLIESLANPGAPQAKVIRVPATAPADAILSRRVAKAVEGIAWTSVRRDGDAVALEGTRGTERHELEIAGSAPPRVRRWNLTRRLEAPSGEKIEQGYYCEVAAGEEPGSIRSVQEWVVNPPPVGNVSFRLTEVRKAEKLPSLSDGALLVRFPAGTQVTDARGEVPVEYVQTEAGVNEDEVAGAARALAQGRARAGEPAPLFDLKDTKGKPLRLQDYRGKTVLLFWFSGRSRPAEAAADFIGQLDKDYRKRGVLVIGLGLLEEGDGPSKAEELRKRFGWSFPVAVDPDGEAMRRYGLEAGVPKVAVVDPEGKLVYVRAGVDPDAVSQLLQKLAPNK